MDAAIGQALAHGGNASITTVGRKTGRPHRVEVGFHNLHGELFISGRAGFRRDWLANLIANPQFTFHLRRGVSADLPAVAEVITDPEERRPILYRILTERWGVEPERARASLERWVDSAPLVRFRVG